MPDIDILIICLVAGLIGVAAGYWIRKLTAESRIGSAEKEAERIVQKAVQEAEAIAPLLDRLQSFRSDHEGGGHFLYGDGGVRFLRDNIDFAAYQAMSTRSGGEVVHDE